jgi:hypothetical protein
VEEGVRAVSPEAGDQERHTEELVKLTIDLCKHLTTLSAAGALIVLAVYREVTFDEWLLGVTLVLFGLTILVALVVVAAGITYFTARGSAMRGHGAALPVEPYLMWASWIALGLFVAGVWSFIVFLLDWSWWVNLIIVVVLIVVLWLTVWESRKRRRAGS